jgi:hypothetical protein
VAHSRARRARPGHAAAASPRTLKR